MKSVRRIWYFETLNMLPRLRELLINSAFEFNFVLLKVLVYICFNHLTCYYEKIKTLFYERT